MSGRSVRSPASFPQGRTTSIWYQGTQSVVGLETTMYTVPATDVWASSDPDVWSGTGSVRIS
ncbi:hypothetical protein EES37_36380 [Streptomyces sp. ADI91-18]|nr:hypothetical protein EES37_36380 [Streptomyces sp. ADI91-18]